MQLNFVKFRRGLKGFRKTSPNIQVVGFTDEDSHLDVPRKGARGLDLKCDLKDLFAMFWWNGGGCFTR